MVHLPEAALNLGTSLRSGSSKILSWPTPKKISKFRQTQLPLTGVDVVAGGRPSGWVGMSGPTSEFAFQMTGFLKPGPPIFSQFWSRFVIFSEFQLISSSLFAFRSVAVLAILCGAFSWVFACP
jgi:hypothetical protein